jgi:hypothetical protein
MAMTDLWTFAKLLSDVAPPTELIDGLVFLDRLGVGPDALRVEIAKHKDPKLAQAWINTVPIDDFIDCAVDDWSIDDPLVQDIADIYAKSWLAVVKAKYGISEGLTVEVLKDTDSGDVMIRLNQL